MTVDGSIGRLTTSPSLTIGNTTIVTPQKSGSTRSMAQDGLCLTSGSHASMTDAPFGADIMNVPSAIVYCPRRLDRRRRRWHVANGEL
jgi:hypothetical protein